jgi:alpha-tubulin suppressor-like RCC1 family protein
VWAWGANSDGRLGDGTPTGRATPVQVVGLANVTSIAAGGTFSAALTNDGAEDGVLWTWGANNVGQLGDGTMNNRFLPMRVPGLPAIATMSVGSNWVLACTTTHALWSWGGNDFAQLGNGSVTAQSVPVRSTLLDGVTRLVTSARSNALALDTRARLWTWGDNGNGQLGIGNQTDAAGPVLFEPQLPASLTTATVAALGSAHALVATLQGQVLASGANGSGQLGNNSTTLSTMFVPVSIGVLADNPWLAQDPMVTDCRTGRSTCSAPIR